MKVMLSVLAMSLMGAPLALAEPPPSVAVAADQESQAAVKLDIGASEADGLLDLAELGDLRAGDDHIVSNNTLQNLTANNSGNSVTANRVDTGAVNLDAGAFAGYNGIGNFVINTGNNNNLQGAVSVTIVMPPL